MSPPSYSVPLPAPASAPASAPAPAPAVSLRRSLLLSVFVLIIRTFEQVHGERNFIRSFWELAGLFTAIRSRGREGGRGGWEVEDPEADMTSQFLQREDEIARSTP
eukprot:758679-Hanusia_phi.AAC.1